jgi:DNA excision repair protein ERCC-4
VQSKQYQQDLFSELRCEDELVILARGLGLLHIITNLLHAYDAAGNNLVLVVGAEERENEWIGEGLSVHKGFATKRMLLIPLSALAEHYALSKAALARGLRVINTDRATVPMRCV